MAMRLRWFPRLSRTGKRWVFGLGILGVSVLLCLYVILNVSPFWASTVTEILPGKKKSAPVQVSVKKLETGTFDRVTVQPGSAQAFQSVQVCARASGYVKDYGNEPMPNIEDKVKKGQVLAVLDVPDLDKLVQHHTAIQAQANAKVKQLEARVKTEQAEWEAAKQAKKQADANIESAKAWEKYRKDKLTRHEVLFKSKAIPQTLLDEIQEAYEAAVATRLAAVAGKDTAEAQEKTHASKVEQAKADVMEAEAGVKVAKAELDDALVQQGFATIPAPFDGVITHRYVDVGNFVHSASTGGGEGQPLFTVTQMDKVFVVVQIPSQHVQSAQKGHTVFVEFDDDPGKQIEAKISRTAGALDPKTLQMRIEIDLLNPDHKIKANAYCKVTVILDRVTNHLAVPKTCLVGSPKKETGSVFVFRDGKARLVPVRLGLTNDTDREVISGLTSSDLVIQNPPPALTDGAPVTLK
jgi:RND family efflux transporter MFP subunit